MSPVIISHCDTCGPVLLDISDVIAVSNQGKAWVQFEHCGELRTRTTHQVIPRALAAAGAEHVDVDREIAELETDLLEMAVQDSLDTHATFRLSPWVAGGVGAVIALGAVGFSGFVWWAASQFAIEFGWGWPLVGVAAGGAGWGLWEFWRNGRKEGT